jgi:Tol biopolymer transport system component
MNSDGSGVRRLTSEAATKSHLAWSPDGRTLAFVLYQRDIFTMSADGKNLMRLTESSRGGDIYSGSVFSPDGRRISYEHNGLYIMNADGTQKTLLTPSSGSGLSPGWSPDGHQIVFGQTDGIYVIKVDGTQLRQLLSMNLWHSWAGHLAWSPDGTRIVFSSPNGARIYMMNADGTGLTPLTFSSNNLMPAWSPNGARIAFCSDRDGNNEIYVMNADGSGQTNITNNPASDCDPAWGSVTGAK